MTRAGLAVTDLGPHPSSRFVGYVTTPGPAGTAAVRALIRELRELPLPDGLTAACPLVGRRVRPDRPSAAGCVPTARQPSSASRSLRNSAASASSV
ncbi:hypothetical protein P3T27_001369 [Kitasatospora sp. MAA19]|uniref:hypothetical protein n=1 Tax=Kitasatospora sp. MAA19 TaxID=3035090 RepID=UPI0024732A23|nr:hypothetical protein [Kitasatospora sp. MAA19]MDH6704666.1 hypothetical protein [Kitasatospora sp. MAA19]